MRSTLNMRNHRSIRFKFRLSFMNSVILLLLTSLLASTICSLPNGAPRCAINPQFIATKHKTRQDSIITATTPQTYTPGGSTVPLSVSSTTGTYMGLLAYVLVGNVNVTSAFQAGSTGLNPAATTNQHVGLFNLANTLNLRAQTASMCTQGMVVNQDPLSTITHASAMNVQGSMNLMWTPPV